MLRNDKITDLMLQRFGLSKINKTLKLNWDSSIYDMFAKTAKFIYDNGFANDDWTNQDYIEAITFNFQYFGSGHTVKSIKPIDFEDIDEYIYSVIVTKSSGRYKTKPDNSFDVKLFEVDLEKDTNVNFPTNMLVVVDPYNTSIKNIQSLYNWKHVSTDNKLTFNGLGFFNANYLIGKYKLFKGIVKSGDFKYKYSNDLKNALYKLVSKLLNPEYRKKRYQFLFKVDDVLISVFEGTSKDYYKKSYDNSIYIYDNQKHIYEVLEAEGIYQAYIENVAKQVIKDYILDTYNVVLQESYMSSQLGKSHARFFETKKNISEEKLTAMKHFSNEWSEWLNDVEIDNDVDLGKLKSLSPELISVLKMLPKSTSGAKPILRFRKLQNHNALGMFTFYNNTIAIDFRKIEGLTNSGLESFVHEYGHFLDFNTRSDNKLLSLSSQFKPILLASQNALRNQHQATGNKLTYLLTPTEIFARAFEYYIALSGYQGSLIKTLDVYQDPKDNRFACFAKNKVDIFTYFDSLFNNLSKTISTGSSYSEFSAADTFSTSEKSVSFQQINLFD